MASFYITIIKINHLDGKPPPVQLVKQPSPDSNPDSIVSDSKQQTPISFDFIKIIIFYKIKPTKHKHNYEPVPS